MIEIEITESMIQWAQEMADDLGQLRNSITKGDGNLAGFVGEVCANQIIQGSIVGTKDYDIIKDGIAYDIKTKRCKNKPETYYECSVAAYNTIQKCDYYVFVRVNNEMTKAWILGKYDKEKYFKDARFLKKGQRDGDNWFKVKANCYNMKISDLDPV